MTDSPRTSPSSAANPPAVKQIDECPRVLVVDDDEAIQEVLRLALTRNGYKTDVVGNGEAAWLALQALPYDLLITDNTMPGMTGWELIIRIRSEKLPIPVILASGTAPPEKAANNHNLLLSAVLRKPFATAELLAAVEEALGPRMVGNVYTKQSSPSGQGLRP